MLGVIPKNFSTFSETFKTQPAQGNFVVTEVATQENCTQVHLRKLYTQYLVSV
jgi:hypothetical protein